MASRGTGLFRATGKRARPVLQRLDGGFAEVEGVEREPADFYPTPPEPTRALLRAEGERLRELGTIWEPACGNGAMLREIEAAGFDAIGSDLHDRGCGHRIDFFATEWPLGQAIVTNPPYQEVNWRDGRGRWIRHALERLQVPYMALLLNWSWPGAGGLGRLLEEHPIARVYLLRWKVDFTGAGAPPMLSAWYVWDRAWRGETALRFLDRGDDARQAEIAL